MTFIARQFMGDDGFEWKRAAMTLLRIAPWVAFGPVTGILSERAIRCHARGEYVLACLYVVLNVAFLVSLPVLTAKIAAGI